MPTKADLQDQLELRLAQAQDALALVETAFHEASASPKLWWQDSQACAQVARLTRDLPPDDYAGACANIVQIAAPPPYRDFVWHDEFLAWYKPEQWLGAHRALGVFLGRKFTEMQATIATLRAQLGVVPSEPGLDVAELRLRPDSSLRLDLQPAPPRGPELAAPPNKEG